jgi:alginate O-acetyltransferase complex protein AlgI
MVFSSITFLYYFLPLVLVLYFLAPYKFKNFVLLSSSLLFYFYGEPVYTVLLVISCVSGYLHGLWIERAKKGRYAKVSLISSVITSVGGLVFFKYTDFFIENINRLFNSSIPLLRITLPIGISFYTFQILSYTIDVYRGNAEAQRNLFNFSMYVSLFPQLIAGPVVRYTTIEKEILYREHTLEEFAYGVRRFITGLSKKVLLANNLGELIAALQNPDEISLLSYWIIGISFTLQVYFDFSGYSDMAIGMGRMFGFRFSENFNYPFESKSITDFWRRWHISLGTWFRDYVYIPLGGNRVSLPKWIRNVIIVWFLTGFWHGAHWNFIIWGLYFAILMIIEKLILRKYLDKIPVILARLYTLFFILISFVIFNADGIKSSLNILSGMLGLNSVPCINSYTLYYLKSYFIILIISIIASISLGSKIVVRLGKNKAAQLIVSILEPIGLLLLLILVTAYLVDGSFNPFLYFRF